MVRKARGAGYAPPSSERPRVTFLRDDGCGCLVCQVAQAKGRDVAVLEQQVEVLLSRREATLSSTGLLTRERAGVFRHFEAEKASLWEAIRRAKAARQEAVAKAVEWHRGNRTG